MKHIPLRVIKTKENTTWGLEGFYIFATVETMYVTLWNSLLPVETMYVTLWNSLLPNNWCFMKLDILVSFKLNMKIILVNSPKHKSAHLAYT